MIASKYKVPRNLIPEILEKGSLIDTRLTIVRFKKNNVNCPRFCVIISRKMDKRAVKRNRLRRQIAEGLRLILKETPKVASATYDLVVIPRKSMLGKDFWIIKSDLQTLLSKLTNHGEIQ